MLLVIRNLPGHIKYSDIKLLIRNKCYIDDIILDRLIKDGNSAKQVTIGVAKEEDAVRIMHGLNGAFVEGQQIHVEEVKKGGSANKNNSGVDYPSNQPQNQMVPGYQMDSANAWNAQTQMFPYGYMAVGSSPAQDANLQAMNMQMMQSYVGYNAMGMYGMTNTTDIAPLMQNNSMTYEYQQGQQLNSTQGQIGASGLEAPAWPGYNAQSQNRGYDSDNNQKSYDAHQNPGIDRYGSQDYQGGSQQNKDYGSRFELNEPRHENLDEARGFDSREFRGNSREFSQGNDRSRDSGSRKRQHSPERGGRLERDKFHSPEFRNQGRGFEGQNSRVGSGGNQGRYFESWDTRGKGLGGNQGREFEDRDSRGKGLGGNQSSDYEGWDSRGKGLGGNQGRDFESRDSRGKGLGSNRGRDFESRDSRGEGFGGNQGSDFEVWDSRGKGFSGNQGRNFEGRDLRGKGLGGNQGKGFESSSRDGGLGSDHGRGYEHDRRNTGFGGLGSNRGGGFDHNSRNTEFGNKGFNRDSHNKGFGNSGGLGGDSRGNGLGSNQGRGFECDSRNTGFGNNRGNFEGNSRGGFSNNQSRGFENNSRAFDSKQGKGFGGQDIFARREKSRESVPPKPFYQQPIKPIASASWSNISNNPIKTSPVKPFGKKPNFSVTKPPNNQNVPKKPENQLNLNPGLPLSQSSPVKPVIPEKRPKLDDAICYEEAPTDKKIINRATSWRGEGVSSIVKSILDRFHHGDFTGGSKAFKEALRNMKREMNTQLDEIIKREYPKNPYPLLKVNEIVALYRKTHPQNEDQKLYNTHFEQLKDLTEKPPDMGPPKVSTVPVNKPMPVKPPKPKYEPPPSKPKCVPPPSQPKCVPPPSKPKCVPPPSKLKYVPLMGPPKTTNVPHAKPPTTPMKKPSLADLLPPSLRQLSNNPRQRQKPVKRLRPIDIEKQAKREQRLLHKMEFLDQNLYKCKTVTMEKALNAVLDDLTDVYTNSIKEYATTDTEEKMVGQEIIKKTTDEFRWTVRLHTMKRILNATKTLLLRFFMNGGRAPKTEVERVLRPYGVTGLKASARSKTPMLTGSVNSFEKFDALCRHTGVPCNGRDGTTFVTAKPLYMSIPMKFRRLLRHKKLNDDDEEGVDFAQDLDDDQFDDDDDDDVIEIVKETDVIELSGDENTLNVPDDIKNDVKCEDSEATNSDDVKCDDKIANGNEVDKTVDLTYDEENEKSVDDKISEAIDEMGDGIVEIDDEEIKEDDLEDY